MASQKQQETKESNDRVWSQSSLDSDYMTESFESTWKPNSHHDARHKVNEEAAVQNRDAGTKQAPPEKKAARRSRPFSTEVDTIPKRLENYAFLENFYRDNLDKVGAYDRLFRGIVDVVLKHMDVNVTDGYSPELITTILDHYIGELKGRFKKYELEVGDLAAKTSHYFASPEIISNLEKHKKNVFDLLETYELELDDVRANNLQLLESIKGQETQTHYLQMKIFYLERGTMLQDQLEEDFRQETTDVERFMAELASRNRAMEYLNTTMSDELSNTQLDLLNARKELDRFKKSLAVLEERNMEELGDLSQKFELNKMFEDGLMSIFQAEMPSQNRPNKEVCRKVVKGWLRTMREAVAESGNDFAAITAEVTDVKSMIIEKENELVELKGKLTKLNDEIFVLKENFEVKKRSAEELAESIAAITEQMDIASEFNEDLKEMYKERILRYNEDLKSAFGEDSYESTDQSNQSDEENYQSESSESGSIDQPSTSQSNADSQNNNYSGKFRQFISNFKSSGSSRDNETSETSLDNEPPGISQDNETSETSLDNEPPEISQDNEISETSLDNEPSRISEDYETSDIESTKQNTTVESTGLEYKKPRMTDVSFSISQETTLAPKVSQASRIEEEEYFAEKPSVKDSCKYEEEGESFKKTIFLTSPHREQPLKVDIDVKPRPLTQTKSREHFICDISVCMSEEAESSPIKSGREYKVPESTMATGRDIYPESDEFEYYDEEDSFLHEVNPAVEFVSPFDRTIDKHQLNLIHPSQLPPQVYRTFETQNSVRSPSRINRNLNPQWDKSRLLQMRSQINRTLSDECTSHSRMFSFSLNRTVPPFTSGPSHHLTRPISPQYCSAYVAQLNKTYTTQRSVLPSLRQNGTYS